MHFISLPFNAITMHGTFCFFLFKNDRGERVSCLTKRPGQAVVPSQGPGGKLLGLKIKVQ